MTTIDRAHAREREFGRSIGVALAVLSAAAWWRHAPRAAALLACAAAGAWLLKWRRPSALRLPAAIFGGIAQTVSSLVVRLLLSLVFVLVITPVGLLMRVMGHDPLRRRRSASAWLPYPARLLEARHYERMY